MLYYLYVLSYLLMATCSAVKSQHYGGNQGNISQIPNQKPVVANVQQQACGIPNGDSSYLKYLQQQHESRYRRSDEREDAILEQRMLGGSDVPNATSSLCWEVSVRTTFMIDGVLYSSARPGTIVGSRTVLTIAANIILSAATAGQIADNIAHGGEVDVTANPITVTTGLTSNRPQTYSPENAGCAKNYTVVQALYHDYNLESGDNGVAVLLLSEPIDFRSDGRCACKLCLSQKIPSVGDTCISSGWGVESIDGPSRAAVPLRYVKQKILSMAGNPTKCAALDASNTTVPSDHFYYAGGVSGEGTCYGDEGAPLFCYDASAQVQYLAGIAEVVGACGSGEASMFTNVSLYLRWIFDNAPLGDVSLLT